MKYKSKEIQNFNKNMSIENKEREKFGRMTSLTSRLNVTLFSV